MNHADNNEHDSDDIFNLPDDEAMQLPDDVPQAPVAEAPAPVETPEPEAPVQGTEEEEGEEDNGAGDDDAAALAADDNADPDQTAAPTPPVNTNPQGDAPAADSATKPVAGEAPAPTGEAAAAPATAGPKAAEDMSEDELRAFYTQVMGPIRANGKEIQLRNPDEAVRMIQQGAGFTKKMQDLQPVKRLIKMLENNELLDEGKLSFLIDLDKKNPAAIQKLLADSQFNPLDADEEKAASYVPGNHQVSDAEIQFSEVLDTVQDTPTGPQFISAIAKQWDAASKQALYREPTLLTVMNDQVANGIYDQITTEMERQKALGNLPAGVSFIEGYRMVGDHLHQSGQLRPNSNAQPAPVNQSPAAPLAPQPVATRVATPAPVGGNDKAKAAAAPKVVPSIPGRKVTTDVLNQSDDDFIKEMEGRI